MRRLSRKLAKPYLGMRITEFVGMSDHFVHAYSCSGCTCSGCSGTLGAALSKATVNSNSKRNS